MVTIESESNTGCSEDSLLVIFWHACTTAQHMQMDIKYFIWNLIIMYKNFYRNIFNHIDYPIVIQNILQC